MTLSFKKHLVFKCGASIFRRHSNRYVGRIIAIYDSKASEHSLIEIYIPGRHNYLPGTTQVRAHQIFPEFRICPKKSK